MILKKAIIIAGLFSLTVHFSSSIAQEIDCGEKYQLALEQYSLGLADSALSILETCLFNKRIHKDLTREESVNIYRLAALSGIMIGNRTVAEKYIRELLKIQPDYAQNWREGDLMEFRQIVEGGSSQPSLKVGFRAGFNAPKVNIKESYTDPENTGAKFSPYRHKGLQFGVLGEAAISRNLTLEAGLGMQFVSFDYKVWNSPENGDYLYEQKIIYLDIPVLIKYYLPLSGALKPYLQGGVSGKFSLYVRENSEDFGKYWYTESANTETTKILATFITDLDFLGVAFGGGFKYDLKKFSILADIRYALYPLSNSKLAKFDDIQGYEDIPPSEEFGYAYDINLITLSYLQISLGFTYNLKYKVY